jgi:hypothetical protein
MNPVIASGVTSSRVFVLAAVIVLTNRLKMKSVEMTQLRDGIVKLALGIQL